MAWRTHGYEISHQWVRHAIRGPTYDRDKIR